MATLLSDIIPWTKLAMPFSEIQVSCLSFMQKSLFLKHNYFVFTLHETYWEDWQEAAWQDTKSWHDLWAVGLEFVTWRHSGAQDLLRQFHKQLQHFDLDHVLSVMSGFFSWRELLDLPQRHVWEQIHVHYHQSAEHSLEIKPRACQRDVSPELLLCKELEGLF